MDVTAIIKRLHEMDVEAARSAPSYVCVGDSIMAHAADALTRLTAGAGQVTVDDAAMAAARREGMERAAVICDGLPPVMILCAAAIRADKGGA